MTVLRSLLLLAGLLPAACSSLPEAVNPVAIYDRVTGKTFAQRTPPPGLDDPYPNLGTVPPRPDRPELRAREVIAAALTRDREASRQILEANAPAGAMPPAPPRGPGEPGLPGNVPPPPSLAAAPAIPWSQAPLGAAPNAQGGTPAPAQLLPEIGPSAPAPPPPDLLAPAPPR